MRKGMLEFCILLILRNGSAYASEMLERLKEAKLLVVEGTLYPLLTRMKNDGLLAYEWKESTAGPPRKYYILTSVGEEFLAKLSENWSDLSQSINHLSSIYQTTQQ